MKARAAPKKKKEVAKLTQLIKEYPVVGIADLTSLPSAQFQAIRKKLKKNMEIRTTKKRLLKLAIENSKDKKGIEKLEDSLEKSMPALIVTRENPFKLTKLLSKNKSKAAAKPGQISPKDLTIPAGPTAFGPGPIIGELGAAGIKAAIEGGKVVVKEDKLLVKEGEEISQKASDMLAKFGIEPMEIGINVVSLFEEGTLYGKDVLEVDEKEYLDKLVLAHNDAFKLALSRDILTKETIKHKLLEAHRDALAIANSQNILTSETVKPVIAKAEAHASTLKEKVPEVKEEIKEEKKEEKPSEEVQENNNQGGN
tara:strand:+ start:4068 stop:5000 length:933 start_codon:yes stop_codon:yes gene_type:complete